MAHKLIPVAVGLLGAIALAITVAVAAPSDDLREAGTPYAGLDEEASVMGTLPITGQQKIAEAIAQTFGVTVEQVMAVRQSMGWGEVYKVFVLAKLTGQSPAQIVAMRRDKGWGEIYQSLGQKPGKGQNLGQVLKSNPPAKPAQPNDQKDQDKGKGRDKEKHKAKRP